jgi:carbohydrate-binding DOMON domain-containing protein
VPTHEDPAPQQTYTHMHTHTCAHTHAHTHSRTQTHTDMHTHTDTHALTHTHTHIHTHTHTQTQTHASAKHVLEAGHAAHDLEADVFALAIIVEPEHEVIHAASLLRKKVAQVHAGVCL